MPVPTRVRPCLVLLALPWVAGCVLDDLPPLTVAESHPVNLIERSLSACADKTAEAETACVRTALSDSGSSAAALAAMMPGCRLGRVCVYDYTTEDRVGYLPAYATHLRYGFHLSFDLTKSPRAAAEVPVTVTLF